MASCLFAFCGVVPVSVAAVRVLVADPYIELRTGAGFEFPIVFVVERGESVKIIKRHTDWFKVRTDKGKDGWVSREQMERTLTESGVQASFRDILLEDYLQRRLQAGVGYGRFEYDPVLILRIGYQLSPNYSIEFATSQVVGSFSTTDLAQFNLLASPVTDSRFVPFLSLGVGRFRNTPRATLVDNKVTTSTDGNAGVGVQFYLTRSFVARADFRQFIVPITESRTDKYREWSFGLSVFF